MAGDAAHGARAPTSVHTLAVPGRTERDAPHFGWADNDPEPFWSAVGRARPALVAKAVRGDAGVGLARPPSRLLADRSR
jgi:hypothetical protein